MANLAVCGNSGAPRAPQNRQGLTTLRRRQTSRNCVLNPTTENYFGTLKGSSNCGRYGRCCLPGKHSFTDQASEIAEQSRCVVDRSSQGTARNAPGKLSPPKNQRFDPAHPDWHCHLHTGRWLSTSTRAEVVAGERTPRLPKRDGRFSVQSARRGATPTRGSDEKET